MGFVLNPPKTNQPINQKTLRGENLVKEHYTGRCKEVAGGVMSEQCRQAEETRGFLNVNTILIFPRKKDVILLN